MNERASVELLEEAARFVRLDLERSTSLARVQKIARELVNDGSLTDEEALRAAWSRAVETASRLAG